MYLTAGLLACTPHTADPRARAGILRSREGPPVTELPTDYVVVTLHGMEADSPLLSDCSWSETMVFETTDGGCMPQPKCRLALPDLELSRGPWRPKFTYAGVEPSKISCCQRPR